MFFIVNLRMASFSVMVLFSQAVVNHTWCVYAAIMNFIKYIFYKDIPYVCRFVYLSVNCSYPWVAPSALDLAPLPGAHTQNDRFFKCPLSLIVFRVTNSSAVPNKPKQTNQTSYFTFILILYDMLNTILKITAHFQPSVSVCMLTRIS